MKTRFRPIKAALLAATFLVGGGILSPGHAHAVSLNVNGVPLSFANGAGDPDIGVLAPVGFSHRYSNVATIGGVSVDAIVTVLSTTGIDSDDNFASGANNLLDELDENGSGGDAIKLNLDVFGQDNQSGDTNFQGETVLRVAFLQSGTQNTATLQNIRVNIKDVDSNQFVEFASIASYLLASTTDLQVATNTSNPNLVPAGSTRFFEPNGSSSSSTDEEHWVQVEFSQLSFLDIKLGARESGSAYFGIEFSSAAFTTATSSVSVAAPSYTVSYNNNGSTAATPTSTTGSGALTIAPAPSRPGFSFAGWNTAQDGTGINVAAGSNLTPSANITLFAQWTAVPTTTTVAPTTTIAAQALSESGLPATGSEPSNRVFVMAALLLMGLGWASLRTRRRVS